MTWKSLEGRRMELPLGTGKRLPRHVCMSLFAPYLAVLARTDSVINDYFVLLLLINNFLLILSIMKNNVFFILFILCHLE